LFVALWESIYRTVLQTSDRSTDETIVYTVAEAINFISIGKNSGVELVTFFCTRQLARFE